MSAGFAAAFAEGDSGTLAERLCRQLPEGQRATLGVLYVSEPAGAALPQLVRELSEATGTAAWVGGVGLGVCSVGSEAYDRPAAAASARGPGARRLSVVRRRPMTRPPICRGSTPAGSRPSRRRSPWSMAIRAAPICSAQRSTPPPRAAPFWSAG